MDRSEVDLTGTTVLRVEPWDEAKLTIVVHTQKYGVNGYEFRMQHMTIPALLAALLAGTCEIKHDALSEDLLKSPWISDSLSLDRAIRSDVACPGLGVPDSSKDFASMSPARAESPQPVFLTPDALAGWALRHARHHKTDTLRCLLSRPGSESRWVAYIRADVVRVAREQRILPRW